MPGEEALAAPPQPRPRSRRAAPGSVLVAVALGGAVGASARHGLALALPHQAGSFDTATLLANALGGLLIGALMVVAPGAGRLRPFLRTGVLGGFTTFSTYIVDIGAAVEAGAVPLAVVFAFATMAASLLAAALGMRAARGLLARDRERSAR